MSSLKRWDPNSECSVVWEQSLVQDASGPRAGDASRNREIAR
jgi:hypothetical protein